MGRKSVFEIALPEIKRVLNEHDRKAFTTNIIAHVFSQISQTSHFSYNKTLKDFISFLLNEKVLFQHELFDSEGKRKLLYAQNEVDDLTLFAGLNPHGYYTHYTAMALHQLTQQIPKTYYFNVEHSQLFSTTNISQADIDRVFSKPQRKVNSYLTFKSLKIFILNGKKTDRLGVIKKKNDIESYEYTDLERTLIDIAIRTVYSGGVFEVLGAYKECKGRVDPVKLEQYLTKMEFRYPYHQVVGFYLEKAGYDPKVLKLFEKDQSLKFYLTYNIRSKEFSKKWNLIYPTGL